MPDRAAVVDVRIDVDDGELFARLYPQLRRFAAVVAPLGTDPDDLIQDAVAATLRRQALTDLADPGVYLRVAVVRLASNERRRLGRADRLAARVAASAPPVTASAWRWELERSRASAGDPKPSDRDADGDPFGAACTACWHEMIGRAAT